MPNEFLIYTRTASAIPAAYFLAFLSLSILFSVFYIMFHVHICLCMLIDCNCNDCLLPAWRIKLLHFANHYHYTQVFAGEVGDSGTSGCCGSYVVPQHVTSISSIRSLCTSENAPLLNHCPVLRSSTGD